MTGHYSKTKPPHPLPLSQRERGFKPFSLREKGWDEGVTAPGVHFIDVLRELRVITITHVSIPSAT